MAVRTLAEIAADRTDLDAAAVAHCEGLMRDLGLLADLAFSDLILWLPVWNSAGYVAAAQVRPSTAATRYPNDLVGTFTPRGRRPELDRAWSAPGLGQVAARTDPVLPAAFLRGGNPHPIVFVTAAALAGVMSWRVVPLSAKIPVILGTTKVSRKSMTPLPTSAIRPG